MALFTKGELVANLNDDVPAPDALAPFAELPGAKAAAQAIPHGDDARLIAFNYE